jgi:zinc transport system substrate-binding protein
MKKLAAFILSMLLLTGCSAAPAAQQDGLKVVATIFPGYDWAANLLEGSGVTPTLLIKNGADLHSFQPTAADMISLSDADLFIYVGGESDGWVGDALKNAQNDDLIALSMMDVLADAVQMEEYVEGMQAEEDEAYDEHVWLSLRNAERVCTAISDALCKLDTDHADLFQANLSGYLDELSALDEAYADTVEAAARKTLLFGDRFPFRYLTDDYGLSYYAAFPGCSAETEASFATISFLAGKADELALPAILTIDGSDQKIAQTIAGNTAGADIAVLTLDSMQSVTAEEIESGISYLSIMRENLDVLKKALS